MHLDVYRHDQNNLLKFKPSVRMREISDLNYSECVIVDFVRWAALTVLETADLLRFFRTTVTGVYKETSKCLRSKING